MKLSALKLVTFFLGIFILSTGNSEPLSAQTYPTDLYQCFAVGDEMYQACLEWRHGSDSWLRQRLVSEDTCDEFYYCWVDSCANGGGGSGCSWYPEVLIQLEMLLN